MDPQAHGSTDQSPGEPGPSRFNYGLVTEIADRRQKPNIPFRPSPPNS